MKTAKRIMICSAVFLSGIILQAQVSQEIRKSISTPDKSEKTRLGVLEFKDGMPSSKTSEAIWDELDYIHGVDAFINGYAAVSQYAIRNGFLEQGIKDNEVIVFSKLMDSKSLFLTANADTYYFWSYIDLSNGPMVIETPPNTLGVFDDMWWHWITDFGVPGPDRGMGGKYLIVPEGYKGQLPEEGYFIRYSRTNRVSVLGRAFIDEQPIAEIDKIVKSSLKIYPYAAGGYGTSIASFLDGKSKLGQLQKPAETKFYEGSGRVMNTIPPADYSYFEMLDKAVQAEPATALDPEVAGQLYAIGIVKGKTFNPDDRMKKILTEAVTIGNAASRTISFNPSSSEGFKYYGNSSYWVNPLFTGGYEFLTPPPEITKEGVKQYPYDGARKLDARIAMFYSATGITPAMCMRLPNIGSQYLGAFFDSKGVALDGAKTYKVVLPKGIPAAKFWSLTVYDNQTRSMLETPQLYPRAGSQNYPTPAAVAETDGSTVVYFGPKKPANAKEGNWIQTVTGKGWFVLVRFYSPLQSFFLQKLKLGEIEEVK